MLFFWIIASLKRQAFDTDQLSNSEGALHVGELAVWWQIIILIRDTLKASMAFGQKHVGELAVLSWIIHIIFNPEFGCLSDDSLVCLSAGAFVVVGVKLIILIIIH